MLNAGFIGCSGVAQAAQAALWPPSTASALPG